MSLSWNEIRLRATEFSDDWKDARYEKGETQSFYNDFFLIFGVRRRSVARYEQHVKKLDNHAGFIDLFWPGTLLVEQKSAGRNLEDAYEQAGEYFDGLSETMRPRYVLLSDFQSFHLRDLEDSKEDIRFELVDLHRHVERFGFMIGVERKVFRDQDPVNIAASEQVGNLHDALLEAGHSEYDLERFLVRIVFFLFADNTGIFDSMNSLLDYIENRTDEDGSDLGPKLDQLFGILDKPVEARPTNLDEDLARFPYINGDLFKEKLQAFSFDSSIRAILLEVCQFNWSNISPAIFGALFQSVMKPDERRGLGAHYTTEHNILKVIDPLFMDGLRGEFERLKARKDSRRGIELRSFQKRLGSMKFLDPACGCGNFLIITYRELRRLEIEVLKEIYPKNNEGAREASLSAQILSLIDVDQFYGIEIEKFPACIAETAMWMMDHIMNHELSAEFSQNFARIPLEKSPHIVNGDALSVDWADLLPPDECSFVLGNPPFIGSKLQSKAQRAQVHRIADSIKKGAGGTLDYVAAWFIEAGRYIQHGNARIGFVATNSITQGEQVAQLWPILLERHRLEIAFAHRTFAWGSDAKGKAHVHVVILGLDHKDRVSKERRLFDYPDIKGQPQESRPKAISPYLFDAGELPDPSMTVREESEPINDLKPLRFGNQPIDGGHYIFDEKEREDFLKIEPEAEAFLRPYIGAREFLQGGRRWILALHDAPPERLAKLPNVRKRIASVRSYREASRRPVTREIASFPTRFAFPTIPENSYLFIPGVSSERREYLPIGWLGPPVIPSNAALILEDATLVDFAILTSAMHNTWLRNIGGRLESRYRYSAGSVYNTFPMPPKDAGLEGLEPHAQAILDARTAHPGSTLSDLYDPEAMPLDLRKAHRDLDRAVDRLYRRRGFSSEHERLGYLFMLHDRMRAPLAARMKGKKRRR